MEKWQIEHKQIIKSFLSELNSVSDQYILKGGTALMECYGLDRFSEDIDLDGKEKGILNIIKAWADKHNYNYYINKDTQAVQRCNIHYNSIKTDRLLKIETSYRNKSINNNEITKINGINVYNLNRLTTLKCSAYLGRDKIRDLYDIVFICNHYYDRLSPEAQNSLFDAFSSKGLQYFDYIIRNQKDDFIDPNKLANEFLDAYAKAGLIIEEKTKGVKLKSVEEDLEL